MTCRKCGKEVEENVVVVRGLKDFLETADYCQNCLDDLTKEVENLIDVFTEGWA